MYDSSKDLLGVEMLSVLVDAGYDSVQDIVVGIDHGIDVHVAGTDFDICVLTD